MSDSPKTISVREGMRLARKSAMDSVRELRQLRQDYPIEHPEVKEDGFESVPFEEPTPVDREVRALTKGYFRLLKDKGLITAPNP